MRSLAKTGLHAKSSPAFQGSATAPARLTAVWLRHPSNRAYDLPRKNPSVDFSGDCRIATQFCMLLSRPSLGLVIFIKYENPSWIFWGLQNHHAILHVAKPPLHRLFNSFQVRKIPHLKKNQLFLRIYVQFQTFSFYILYGGKNK